MAMMGVGFGLATAIAAVAIERPSNPEHAGFPTRGLAAVAFALVLAAGMGAISVGPALALKGATERAGPLSRTDAEACSLHPARLIEFVAPDSMGNSQGFQPAARWIGEPRLIICPCRTTSTWDRVWSRWPCSGLAGADTWLLCWAFCAAARWCWRWASICRHTRFSAAWCFPSRTCAFRRSTWSCWSAAWPCWPRWARCGYLQPSAQPWRRVLVLLGLMLVLALLARRVFPEGWAAQVTRGALAGSLALAGVLTVQFLAARRARLAPVLLIAIVGLDLAAATWPLQVFAPRQVAAVSAPAARVVLADSPGHGEPPRLYRANNVLQHVGRFSPALPRELSELWLLQTFITNTANIWGIATLPGYDAAIPAGLDRIWASGLRAGQAVLRLLGARYALLPVDDPQDPKEKRTGIEPMLDPLPGTRLYRVPGALPRVFLVGQAYVVDDPTALHRIFDPAIIAGRTAWIAPESGVQSLIGPADTSAGTCRLDSYADNRLQATCQAQRPALAVFVEQYAKGWRATLDEQPAPIVRANLIMRAVAVGPGEHRIVMEFRTPGLRAGGLLTLLSLIVLLVLLFWRRQLGRQRQ